MGTTGLDTLQLTTQLNSNDGTKLIDAVTKAATFAGGVTANVTGNAATATSALPFTPQVLSGDGAITIPSDRYTEVFITKGSAAAITIAAPTVGTDDSKEILIYSETAFAHQITCPDGFNAKGSSGTATASAAANNYLRIVARNGHWRIVSNVNFTIA